MIDSRIAYTTTEHSFYGCETGCCGWVAYAYDASGNLLHQSEFEFSHDGDSVTDAEAFAQTHFPGAPWNGGESDWRCPDD
jgi:hypothetical protein